MNGRTQVLLCILGAAVLIAALYFPISNLVERREHEANRIVLTACGPKIAKVFKEIFDSPSRDTAYEWARKCQTGD